MSTAEPISKKKRSAPESTTQPPAEGDHRKRRRNRTTQSCLNCHTSKRMCDRKRPACARCTQLGLTGLCVYEVDDPNQRPDAQDESSRLLKRVAELEGVIRELKNKPHPRWTQAGSPGSGSQEPCHSPSRIEEGSDLSPSPSKSVFGHSDGGKHASLSSTPPSMGVPEELSPLPELTTFTASPLSSPSPVTTPCNDFAPSRVLINDDSSGGSSCLDLRSIFASYPSLAGYHDSSCNRYMGESGDIPLNDISPLKQGHLQCNCLSESSAYGVVLELSLRLRRAAEMLAKSPCHRAGAHCILNQRICELDTLAANMLPQVDTVPYLNVSPYNMCSPPFYERSAGMHNTISNQSLPLSTISPSSLPGLLSWPAMNVSSACEDTFMSWEPPRRC